MVQNEFLFMNEDSNTSYYVLEVAEELRVYFQPERFRTCSGEVVGSLDASLHPEVLINGSCLAV